MNEIRLMDVVEDGEEIGQEIVLEMLNGTGRNLVYRYLALQRVGLQQGLVVEVNEEQEDMDMDDMEVEVAEEVDEGYFADMEEMMLDLDSLDELDEIPPHKCWSWLLDVDVSLEALMEEDAAQRFK